MGVSTIFIEMKSETFVGIFFLYRICILSVNIVIDHLLDLSLYIKQYILIKNAT